VLSAVDAGADAVLVTCSSIGPAVEATRPFCPVPLFRIDEEMADRAIATGPRIGVLATLKSTLEPTRDLVAPRPRPGARSRSATTSARAPSRRCSRATATATTPP
jgi:Asp/Glu/hydantoin racemase